jgi:serine/threonine-protein kinase
MELVRGASLEQQRPRFGDVAWALPILREAAEGLLAIHEQGVVHRDLKPANVLLEEVETDPVHDGGPGLPPRPSRVRPKIADFGVSRFEAQGPAIDRAIDAGAPTLDAIAPTLPAGALARPPPTPGGRVQLTGTGMLIGTPLYMPPEAAYGSVGPPADVFAFGVIAHEMLSGASPFTVPPLFLALTGASLPVPTPIAGLPGRLSEVLSACMKASPADRPSMPTVVAAFQAVPRTDG